MPDNPTTITDAVFGAVDDPARPLLTFYDDRTGERTELSTATLANWAAKTANYLVDEIGVTPGDRVLVDLPEHWQTAAILLGAWWAGADVSPRTHDPAASSASGAAEAAAAQSDPLVVFTDEERLDGHEVLVASLDAFALPLRDLPPGVGDYGTAVRVHGDRFSPARTGSATSLSAVAGMSVADVLAEARAAADRDGISPGSRVLSVREWHTAAGITANLVAPFAVGAALVWVRHPASLDDLRHRAEVEKTDVVLT
ncbi:TIGR03089 family protein [Gordonia sinesedis]